ncbi:hypothetical protein TNCT_208481 [Trichonephila clavata]|uniref:Uncharacterized protein n=1 Tax=Trichonephila clavata TaxID=2740835 RepID=A0A8X6HEQ1_TRICU|nr:hypothetical protein TNCT_208481 [Trichonephila clavata]
MLIATKCRGISEVLQRVRLLAVILLPLIDSLPETIASHHTRRLAPDLWSISISLLRNLTNNVLTVHSLLASAPHALLMLVTVAVAVCLSRSSDEITIHTLH